MVGNEAPRHLAEVRLADQLRDDRVHRGECLREAFEQVVAVDLQPLCSAEPAREFQEGECGAGVARAEQGSQHPMLRVRQGSHRDAPG